MLEVVLGYDQGAKNPYLTMGLYSKDTATKMDLVAVDGSNGGLKARIQYIKESKLVEVSGLIQCDLVNSDRLLLNSLFLKKVLYRQRDSFTLMADDASRDCIVRIREAKLCVRHVKLSDEKYRNIQQSLSATPACYPIKCVVMKTHSVAQGISTLNWENTVDQLPNRVFIAMMDNDAYTGSIAKNRFNFKHFSASLVAICLNGEIPTLPFKLNFADNHYMDGYRSLLATTGQIDMDNGLDITRAD